VVIVGTHAPCLSRPARAANRRECSRAQPATCRLRATTQRRRVAGRPGPPTVLSTTAAAAAHATAWALVAARRRNRLHRDAVIWHRTKEHRVGDALQLELELVLGDGVGRCIEDSRDRELRARALLTMGQRHRQTLLPGNLADLDVKPAIDRLREVEQ